MNRRTVLAGLAAWPASGRAATGPRWSVALASSTIGFVYRLDGAEARGRFTTFSGAGRFDPGAPEAARFTLSVDSASIDLGNALVSAYATSSEWFDARHHPHVRYRLTGLAPLGGAQYKATGEIALKGRRALTETVMTLQIGAREARAAGTLAVSREAFALGTEISDLFVAIGDRVEVRFALVARRAG